jgi:hypothetical protein
MSIDFEKMSGPSRLIKFDILPRIIPSPFLSRLLPPSDCFKLLYSVLLLHCVDYQSMQDIREPQKVEDHFLFILLAQVKFSINLWWSNIFHLS